MSASWVDIFDTTLRDGAQFEGISLSVDDKLRIAEQLDWLGVRYVEGGYPQANPKDEEFFRRARTELRFETAELVAFGSTRRPAGKVDVDPTLKALVEAGAPIACIVGETRPGDLQAHCAKALLPWQIPRELWFLESLPINERGKFSRRGLAEIYLKSRRVR